MERWTDWSADACMNEGPFTQLPANLPVPQDDGACNHLPEMPVPDLDLPSTSGERVHPGRRSGVTVLYAYPLTGRPGVALPEGWDSIPGARGCTPESCAFRDLHGDFRRLGAEVFGLSTQSTGYQREVRDRLHLPFELLSDEHFVFTDALRLPTFTVEGSRLLRRLTLILRSGRVERVFYPIFPPDRHAAEVVAYLNANRTLA
jgi:peroxiredoxin